MRKKHNKKRNTAFLYEAMCKELSKAIYEDKDKRKDQIVDIMKEYFSPGSPLKRELELYRTIYESEGVKPYMADKLINEARKEQGSLDKKEVYDTQTELLSEISNKLGKDVYQNFIPEYRQIATIYQVFNNDDITLKERAELEDNLMREMIHPSQRKDDEKEGASELEHVDNLAFYKAVEKYNEKYSDKLSEENQKLMKKFIYSFDSDNESEFGYELNKRLDEAIDKIEDILEQAEEFKEDEQLKETAEKSIRLMEKQKQNPNVTDDKMINLMRCNRIIEEFEDAN